MPRIAPVPDEQAGLAGRAAYAYSRRRYGRVLEPATILRHHPGVFWTWSTLETVNQKLRRVLPERLGHLAQYRATVRIGCSWGVDFGSGEWARAGLEPQVLRDVAADRLHGLAEDERAVVDYADAMTDQPPTVDDAMVAALRRRFGDAGVVELSYLVALENMRSRFNASLGLTAQGFCDAEACRIAALSRAAG